MGLLRLLLALTVLNWHYEYSERLLWIEGHCAVLIFFMMSGFYMAMVVAEKYGNDTRGLLLFFENRAVRLLPVYLVVLFVSSAVFGVSLFDHGPLYFVDQILIFPKPFWDTVTLRPYSFDGLFLGHMYTVALEMMFYAITPFIVLRGLPFLFGAFALTAAVNGMFWYCGVDQRTWQYDFFPSILMYCLAGVLVYRMYRRVAKWHYPKIMGYAALPLILLTGWLCPNTVWTNSPSIFAFYAVCAVAIPFLFAASKDSRFDRFVADLSYPLYVVHFPVIWFVSDRPWLGGEKDGAVAVLGLSLACAIALTFLVDRPMQNVRKLVRRLAVAKRPQRATDDSRERGGLPSRLPALANVGE